MNILFRADSSSTIGTGHIMRDLVLAKQYPTDNIIFATQELEGNINYKIIESGYNLEILESNSIDELDSIIKKLNIDKLVIDHYSIDYSFEKQLKVQNLELKIMVLDDTYEKHYCDILLNHNISADSKGYKDLVPDNCELRCGAKYTLIRDEFKKAKNIRKDKNNIKYQKIFIAMGGTDNLNINIKILKILQELDNIEVSIVTTTANKNLNILKEFISKKNWIKLFVNTTSIARLMKDSDFAIVTPSVTLNEVVFMGLPFIAIKIADNQEDIYQYFKKDFLVLEYSKINELKNNIQYLIENYDMYLQKIEKEFL